MDIKKDFAFIRDHIYLDSAAGALKPKQVIDELVKFYNEYPINPHSADSAAGVIVMNKINEARELVAKLVNAKSEEVIFTSGTTEGLNRISQMLAEKIKADDEIILTPFNHSSNIVPWLEIAKAKGARIIYSFNVVDQITDKTRIIAYAQENNTVANELNVGEIFAKAKEVGAFVINDAAQAIMHEKVSLDFFDAIVFSGNKLYGPTGTGALIIKEELLSQLKPTVFGGGATAKVMNTTWISKEGIEKYEPGTVNTSGIIALGAAIKYFNSLVDRNLFAYERDIAEYAFDKLNSLDKVVVYSKKGDRNIIFNIDGVSAQDVVSHLGHKNIILRSGSHCAKMLDTVITTPSTIRISIGAYNNKDDINKCIEAIKQGGDFLEFI